MCNKPKTQTGLGLGRVGLPGLQATQMTLGKYKQSKVITDLFLEGEVRSLGPNFFLKSSTKFSSREVPTHPPERQRLLITIYLQMANRIKSRKTH